MTAQFWPDYGSEFAADEFAPSYVPPLDDPLPLSRRAWIAAALGALLLHLSGAAVAYRYLQPDNSDDLGAPAIAVGVDIVSPRRDAEDLPVGPDTEASAQSPAVVEQKEVLKETDLPKTVTSESDNPNLVASPTDTKNPKDDPKTPTVQAMPSEQSAATEATAMPSVANAPESTSSLAPSPGTGESAVRERVTWEKELAAHFNKFKRYPAERSAQSAEVTVSFALDSVGHIISSRLVKGSGDAAFDQAALDMLQRADPVPAPPPLVVDQGLSFTLPVIFHVKPQK
jgi:periplasmic protein TonB